MLSWVYYLIAAILTALFLTLAFTVLPKQKSKVKDIVLKVFACALGIVLIVRYLGGTDALSNIMGISNSPIQNSGLTVISLLLTWGMYASIFFVLLHPFFKIKFSNQIIKFFVFPIAVLNFIFLIFSMQGIVGATATTSFNYRCVLMAVEAAFTLSYAVYVWVHDFSFKLTLIEIGILLLCIFGILVASMPSYIPQALFGYANPRFEVDGLSQTHRIFLYFSFIIPVLIYLALRKKDKKVIKFSLLFLSLATLFSFMLYYKFSNLANPLNWPIHLCHTAMFIVPICIVFKWEKLFYFTFFINVLGAFIAMAMPNTTGNIFSLSLIHFWLNHICAFFMPILCVALKIYQRPKLKQFIYSAVAFAIYFVFILIINAWFLNYGSVDYFFLNSDFVAEKLGKWAEDLRNIIWTFNIGNLKFIFYPVYQFLFFLVYIIAAAGMWFLYEQCYVTVDLWGDMANRKRKIKMDYLALQSKMEGRSLEEPMSLLGTNKLILNHFSKKYGNSKTFAVKDATLEIKGGEIFGFLGPNGAGKSTIIKSIVGIQPITEGNIEVCGFDVEKQSVQAKQHIGFVPDHYALYEKLTGREYINYIADLYEVNQTDRTKRIDKYVDLFELTGAFDNQMKTYSHGMKQKIAIMAALVHNPKIWILDEPLTGLDPNSIFQVKECMKQHAKEGNIVFFSSHIIDVVERICSKIAIIKKGEIQCVKTIKELSKENIILEKFYLSIIGNVKNNESKKVNEQSMNVDNINKNSVSKFFKKLKNIFVKKDKKFLETDEIISTVINKNTLVNKNDLATNKLEKNNTQQTVEVKKEKIATETKLTANKNKKSNEGKK